MRDAPLGCYRPVTEPHSDKGRSSTSGKLRAPLEVPLRGRGVSTRLILISTPKCTLRYLDRPCLRALPWTRVSKCLIWTAVRGRDNTNLKRSLLDAGLLDFAKGNGCRRMAQPQAHQSARTA